MHPNLQQNTTNPDSQDSWVECLFCYTSFKPKTISKDRTSVEIHSDLFSTFSIYMKWESPKEHQFDFSEEHFPFCSSCRNNVVRVFKLDEQIQNVISDVISKIVFSQKRTSKKISVVASEKVEFYRIQTKIQHELSAHRKLVEHGERIAIEKKHDNDCPVQCPTTEDKVLAPSSPFNGSILMRLLAPVPAKSVWIPDRVQSLGPKKFLYDNKYFFTRSHSHWQCLACDQFLLNEMDLLRHWETACCSSLQQRIEIVETVPSKDDFILPETSGNDQKYGESRSEEIPAGSLKSPCKVQEKNFVCTLCGSGYSSNQNLLRHTFKRHLDDSCKTFACQTCSQKFLTQSLLKNHMECHRKIPCRTCGEIYLARNMSRYLKHMHSTVITSVTTTGKHLRRKEYKCNVCHKSFINNWGLAQHLKMKRCGSETAFSPDSSEGKNQKKSSDNPKKFQCQVCRKMFSRRFCLSRHVQKLHAPDKDTALQSRVCGKT